jgi:biopolymer transport protein TolR
MAMSSGSGSGLKGSINVTPLIDVLLVLLIIFLMITPMKPYGLETEVPQPPPPDKKSAPPRESTVVAEVLNVNGVSVVKLNKQEVSWAELPAHLTEIYKRRGQRVLFVKGEEELFFEDVARVIDATKATRLDISVALLTNKMLAGGV